MHWFVELVNQLCMSFIILCETSCIHRLEKMNLRQFGLKMSFSYNLISILIQIYKFAFEFYLFTAFMSQFVFYLYCLVVYVFVSLCDSTLWGG